MKNSVVASLALIVLAFPLLLSNSNGPGGNRTGAPGSAGTCQGCHGGSADLGASLSVRMIDKSNAAVVTSYEAGKEYTIELVSSGGTSTKRGFQFTLVDGSGKTLGTFSNPAANCGISSSGNASIVGHTAPGSGSSWSCDWTAPTSGAVDLTLHATSICSNSNGNNSGDQYSKLTQVYTPNTASSEAVFSNQFRLLGNPVKGIIVWSQKAEIVQLYNAQGQVVLEANGVESLDASLLPKGLYTLLLTSANQVGRLQVVLQ